MKRLLTPEQEEYLRNNSEGRMAIDLTELFNAKFGLNLTCAQIKNWKARNKVVSGLTRVEIANGFKHQKLFTEEQEAFLQANYKGISNKDLHRLLTTEFAVDVTVNQVKAFKQRNKLDSGLKGTEGIPPPNRGKRMTEYMTPDAIERTKATRFQKGNKPATWLPVGSERVDAKDGYVLIKTKEPNVYEHKHRVIWEREHGLIPDGHNVIFLNGDRTDLRLENLALISKATHALINKNGLRYKDPELTKTGIIIGELIAEAGKANRRLKE